MFDEHTDYVLECKKIGFIPIKLCDYYVKEFDLYGKKYIVLGRNECYSGWEINLVPMEVFDFNELLFIALKSKIYAEKVVSIGLILKYYYNDFLTELKNFFLGCKLNKDQKKLIKLILKDISKNSYEVGNMKELLKLCNLVS